MAIFLGLGKVAASASKCAKIIEAGCDTKAGGGQFLSNRERADVRLFCPIQIVTVCHDKTKIVEASCKFQTFRRLLLLYRQGPASILFGLDQIATLVSYNAQVC